MCATGQNIFLYFDYTVFVWRYGNVFFMQVNGFWLNDVEVLIHFL